MITVADSSSLIALSICNCFDLLDMFFDKIIDAVMKKVDENGAIIGFSILNVSAIQNKPLEISINYNAA